MTDAPLELAETFARTIAADKARGLIGYSLSYEVLLHYVGPRWVSEKINLHPEPDPYMHNEFDEDGGAGENRFTYLARVQRLGDAIFSLRNSIGFGSLLSRFHSRPTRPCYHEAETAARFADSGFQVEIVEETGAKGADFDFKASRSGSSIFVEVTEKVDSEFSVASVVNTLSQKRKQLPRTGPCVIYVILPFSWILDGKKCETVLNDAIRIFFRATGRVARVVFVWEAPIVAGEGRVYATADLEFDNPNARQPVESFDFMYKDVPFGSFQDFLARPEAEILERVRRPAMFPGTIMHWCWERGMLPDRLAYT